MTELIGFAPNADEHKVQWLSASGDDRFVRYLKPFWARMRTDGPASIARYFDGKRLGRGEFSAKFYERIGIEDGSVVPERLRPHLAAGVQRAIENTLIRMAGDAESICVWPADSE